MWTGERASGAVATEAASSGGEGERRQRLDVSVQRVRYAEKAAVPGTPLVDAGETLGPEGADAAPQQPQRGQANANAELTPTQITVVATAYTMEAQPQQDGWPLAFTTQSRAGVPGVQHRVHGRHVAAA